MARGRRASGGTRRKTGSAPESSAPTETGGLPLPSPVAGTNLVIADIVLRAAGGLLRDRLEKGLLTRNYDAAKARRLVDKRGVATSAMLWGASHLARRSPLGLALVAGGLAAKVFYDRGKRLEARRGAGKTPPDES